MLEYLYNFISACTVGIIGWSFHTSNRITRLEQSQMDLKEYIKDLFTQRFDSVDTRFERLEKQLNGRHED